MARACLLIADDLTGACDAAVHFAMRGYAATASVSAADRDNTAPVVAINTDSREYGADSIHRMMAQTARTWFADLPRILYKKIDSTLRGNAGIEIKAAAQAFECDATVISPALPALGRIVENGWLRLPQDPSFAPIDVAARLHAQGINHSTRALASDAFAAIEGGERTLIVDASNDADLDLLARSLLRHPLRILWAGSAGLAAAIARSLPRRGLPARAAAPAPGPVIFCAGSDHKATLGQLAALTTERGAVHFSPEAEPENLREAIRRGRQVIVHIPRSRVDANRIGRLILNAGQGALLLTGGDTAALVLRAIGAERIDLTDEIVCGIPHGILRGGELDGLAVATKSGGFGAPHALIQVADFFSGAPGIL